MNKYRRGKVKKHSLRKLFDVVLKSDGEGVAADMKTYDCHGCRRISSLTAR